MKLDAERLREILSYNPETGVFTWKIARGVNGGIGEVAGSINAKGYLIIAISGRGYRAHRLAWLYVFDAWPENDIDHINRNKTDNRIANLRAATRAQNIWNTRVRCNSSSGIKGVWFDKKYGLWAAQITMHRKKKWLGRFVTIEEASKAYSNAASMMHGEFSSTGNTK
jgi:hypothetical protein